jgi:hypothetical protein
VNRRTLIPQGPTLVPVACELVLARGSESRSDDVLILLCFRTLDAWRRLHRHGRAITTVAGHITTAVRLAPRRHFSRLRWGGGGAWHTFEILSPLRTQ